MNHKHEPYGGWKNVSYIIYVHLFYLILSI
jgi:hypothetical protein